MSTGPDVGDEASATGGSAPAEQGSAVRRPRDAYGPGVLEPTDQALGPTGAATDTDLLPSYGSALPSKDVDPPTPGPRQRDRLLWLWPVVAVAAMAVAGWTFGPAGTLLTAVVLGAVLVVYVGEEIISTRLRLGTALVALTLAAGIIVGQLTDVVPLRSAGRSTDTPRGGPASPLDLRGRRVSAKDIQGRDLRGALLAGAVLDGLDLRGRDMRGVSATGASFRGALLEHARLGNANLRGAGFQDACMYRADLTGARLDGADASGADVTAVTVSPAAADSAAAWPTTTSRVPPCR